MADSGNNALGHDMCSLKEEQMGRITRSLRCPCDSCPSPKKEKIKMPRFRVRYYYLATGMEGRADEKDYGIVEAWDENDACEIIAKRKYPDNLNGRRWFRGCLSATWINSESLNIKSSSLKKGEWQSMKDCPEALLYLADKYPPQLGQHVCKIYTLDSNIRCIVEFDNPSIAPLRWLELPP